MTLSKLVVNVKDKATFGLSLLRIWVGIVFITHGWTKITGIAGTAGYFGGLGIPAPTLFAWLSGLAEFGGGILLLVGFFTRYAAFAIAIDMIVAIVTLHLPNGFWIFNNGYEYTLTMVVIAVALIINGAGKWSLEKKWLGKELG